MRASERRDLIRIVAPPVLALGLVALLVRPVETGPAPALPPTSITVVAPGSP